MDSARVEAPIFQAGLVLIVDDNSINRYMLSKHVTQIGHAVETASNGREALQMVRNKKFDLVLLDIEMPELDGNAVLEAMKADRNLRGIPVIMVSGEDTIDSVVHCIENGAEDYLVKPFNPVILNARVNACMEKKRLYDQQLTYIKQIEEEQNRSNDLLHAIFPKEIVQELKETNAIQTRRHANVAVMFADIVGFTAHCDTHEAEEVVGHLQKLVERWENIALTHGVEKIKTIGDAFMATSGLLKTVENPVLNCIRCGIEMISEIRKSSSGWDVRIGIHSGPVVAGVLGRRQYLYDLWGDTVNTASRIESNGTSGHVSMSKKAWEQVSHCSNAESLGIVAVKGKGNMEIFRFTGFQ
jgi:class 3 adenylate cyclase